MSFRTNAYQQITLNDRLNNLTERERRFLDKSWAKSFAERIFPLIDESRFGVLYCNDNGRPNTPVNVIVGALFLKEMTRDTDEELLECILLDPRHQYALHLTSFDEIPFSDRTLSRFRERLYLYEVETGKDLLKEEIERLAGEFSKMLNIHSNLKRMDSVMVSSSCKKMGRLELMYTCVSNLVKAIVKANKATNLPEHLLKYAEESDKNSVCYRLDSNEVQTRLETVLKEALFLYELTKETYADDKDFQKLERMLQDQSEDGELKQNSKIKPTSLQNPSDEDATYRKKSGKGYQGYVGNFVEDCGENGNIIAQYDYDVNLHSDAEFAEETINKLGQQEEKTVLITDGAYASEDNFKAAEENNIELVPTTLTAKEPSKFILNFKTKDDYIETCPAGHPPIDCKYNEERELYRAHFDKQTCENCPHKNECPVILQKKTALIKLAKSAVSRAKYIKKLSTEEYKEYARKRNGVEGIPSVLRRRYGVDQIPVRGLLRSKMWFGLKIGAINIKRVIAALQNPQFLDKFCGLFVFSSRKLFSFMFLENFSGFVCVV